MQTQNLHDYVEKLKGILFRRWKVMILTFVVVSIASISFRRSQPPLVYQAAARVQYQTPIDALLGGDLKKLLGRLPYRAVQTFMGGAGSDAIDTQIEIISSHAVLRPVLTRVGTFKDDIDKRGVHRVIEDFQKNLRIERKKKTNIFIIKVNATEPELASQLANAVAQTYKVEELRSKRRNGEAIKDFTLKQLDKTTKRIFELKELKQNLEKMEELNKRREAIQEGLKKIEDKLFEHMKEICLKKKKFLSTFIPTHPKIVDLEYQLRVMDKFIELKAPEQDLIPEGEIYYVMARLNLREKPTLKGNVLLTFDPYTRVGVLKEEFNAKEEIIWCYIILPDSTHGWVSKHHLQEKMDITALMSEYIGMEVAVSLSPWANLAEEKLEAQWEIVDIDQRIHIISNKLKAINIKSLDMEFLQGELKVNQDIYNVLRRKLSNVEISQGDYTSAVVILQDASPPRSPLNTRTFTHIPLALLIGFFMAIAVGLTIESVSGTIESPEEIERFTKRKVLSAMPNMSSHLINLYQISTDKKKFKKKDRRLSSVYFEAYRHLMTNIGIQLNSSKNFTILITSSVAKEGKTTTTTNLGVCYAEFDKKTLVVSCNVRHPAMFRIYGVKREGGITDIVNKKINWREAVQKTRLDYLDVVSAGKLVTNIPKILSSPIMERFFKEAREEYEVIIIDSPPALLVTDSLILASKVDGVLVVYSSGETNKNLLEKNIRQFEVARANILGLVMNQKNQLRWSSGKYYYYYYRNYYYPSDHVS